MISMFTVNFAFLVSAACGQVSSDIDQRFQQDALQRVFGSSGFAERFAESYLAENDVVPAVTADEQLVVQEVQQLLSEDNRDEAEALLKENLGLASSAVYDYLLANLYFQDEKLDLAAVTYESATRKWPRYRQAWQNLGIVQIKRGEFSKAIPAFVKVIEMGGGTAICYGLLGFAHSSEGHHLSAESAFRMAILLDPSTKDWQMGLARAFFDLKRWDDAIALTGNMLESDPESAQLWILQANAYIGLEKPMKAAENFEIVDRLGKATPDSLMLLGDIYLNSELFAPAVDVYMRVLEGEEPELGRLVRSAKILSARNANDQSKRLLSAVQTTIGDDETDPGLKKEVLRLSARIALAEGDGDSEARILKQIVDLDPLDGDALLLLGRHAVRTSNDAQAIFYFERAMAIDASEADANLELGKLLSAQGKYAEALPKLRRAQQINPREPVQRFLEQIEKRAGRGG